MKKCVIVLGMHRSGTSALMGVLKALGVEVGSDLLKANDDNPKGFFEHKVAVNINERLLASLGFSWDSPDALPEGWWKQGYDLEGYKSEISRLLKSHFKDAGLIGMKDPRLCRLLPLWTGMLEELGVETSFIIPLRHPLETAGSLKSVHGFSLKKSLSLWMAYMLDAELYSRRYPRIFITFDGLLGDAKKTVADISNTLDIQFPKSYRDAGEEIERFLEKGLKRYNVDAARGGAIPVDGITDYYSLLLGFAEGMRIKDDDLLEIDGIRDRFGALERNGFKIAFITPSHKLEVLERNLLRSKIIKKEKLIVQTGYTNVPKAYNEASAGPDTDIRVYLHHDVWLPDDFEQNLVRSIREIEKSDPDWGVLGVAGATLAKSCVARDYYGYLRDRDQQWGDPGNLPHEVDTLDELMLIVKDKELKFDADIPSAHFYGADICMQAKLKGKKNYAINAYCHHNSGLHREELPGDFQIAESYIREKYKKVLPIATTCTIIHPENTEKYRAVIEDNLLAIAEKDRAIARYESRLIYIPFLFRQYRAFRKKFVYPIRDFFKGNEKEQA